MFCGNIELQEQVRYNKHRKNQYESANRSS